MMSDEGYCVCGLASEDPMHAGWHHIYLWNLDVFGKETIRRHKVFDKVYGHEFEKKPRHVADPVPF